MKKLFPLFLLIPLVFSGCGKSDPPRLSLDSYNIELKAGDISTVKVMSGETGVAWRIENPYVATVDNGKVTGIRVGKTMLLANSTPAVVNVTPRYMLYEEPVKGTRWGMTKNEIYKLMGDKFPDRMEGNLFIYNIESSVNSFKSYEFDKNERLIAVNITVNKEFGTELDNFLAERYMDISGDSTTGKHYLNALTQAASTMLISRTSYDDDYWVISYRDVKYRE